MKKYIKNLKDSFSEGDEVKIVISKPVKGKFPIGKVVDNGVTFTFEFGTKGFWNYGSIWLAKITSVKDRNLVGIPIKELVSVDEKKREYDEKINQLEEFSSKLGIKFTKTNK